MSPVSGLAHGDVADREGIVEEIDNRRIAKVAKLAGAPEVRSVGVLLRVRAHERVIRGQPLYTILIRGQRRRSPSTCPLTMSGRARIHQAIVVTAILPCLTG